MSPSEFVMLIDLYRDVVVDFKEYENTNKLQYITIDFLNSDDPREIYCEIVADFKNKTAHIHHVLSMSADQKTVDLNKLGRVLKDGAKAIFVSDQTELPTDEEKHETKEAKGQLSLLKENKA